VDTSLLDTEEFTMSDRSTRYRPEFKRQMVALASTGRTAASLSKEFGPSAWTIGLWIKQAARDGGTGDGGLSSPERQELARLRRENRRLQEEREILSKAAAWFATQGAPSKRSTSS
jgi:transposase